MSRSFQALIAMRNRLATIVNERRPRWKREWVRRLRAESGLTETEKPTPTVRLMDETLAQFCSLLETRPDQRWLSEHRPSFGRLRTSCRCGLNPLLTYFASGQLALEVALGDPPPVPADQCAALTVHWHFMAQREIESLCGSCCHVCAPALVVSGGGLADVEARAER